MAIIHKDSRLPDYFVQINANSRDERDNLLSLYEEEKVILLKNYQIEFDKNFFSQLRIPNDKQYKKFKAVTYISELEKGNDIYPYLCKDLFSGERKKLKYFQEQLRSVVCQVIGLLNELSEKYQITKHMLTYRGTLTCNENLHVDVYKDEISTHHFRLFVNLDSAHRVWRTSWRLSDLIANDFEGLPREKLHTLSSAELVKAFNFHFFGGLTGAYEDRGHPMHTAFFEPGEIWFVDSRTVSHQIFYGRQAISSESVVEKEKMLDPNKHYLSRVEARRSMLLNQIP